VGILDGCNISSLNPRENIRHIARHCTDRRGALISHRSMGIMTHCTDRRGALISHRSMGIMTTVLDPHGSVADKTVPRVKVVDFNKGIGLSNIDALWYTNLTTPKIDN
jgi:hypothetical protein